jgi:transcriptional regulator with XRE-family HTH domain
MFAKRLKELRLKSEYSQKQLGDLLGITQQAVQKWEKAIAHPDIDAIIKMANLFDVTVDYLLGRTDTPKVEIVKAPPNSGADELYVLKGSEPFTPKQAEYIRNLIESIKHDD